MSGDDFDAFLKRYGLERNRQCLLDNEYDTIDSILDMPGEEMSAIGLKFGAITKIKRAQRDHNQQAITTPTAPPVVAISTSILTPASTEREYNPPVLNPRWTCASGFHIHDIFIRFVGGACCCA
ncbi:uncharacterized protein BJ171DRAFT_567813 [Polychytrium aggregatum]|uniref:uncharacterized protein n=1 Tax=Polychytrium aggregatum TaxID=110093 RepID=UPI0022FEECDC|nr:uncharacterized protein BJ171DRAFT_567813 [Polychytrium aggregatum]KAI9204763.1 hypothetical protein BJ171DRAFT_567813 [Polychytrium aggregatum]